MNNTLITFYLYFLMAFDSFYKTYAVAISTSNMVRLSSARSITQSLLREIKGQQQSWYTCSITSYLLLHVDTSLSCQTLTNTYLAKQLIMRLNLHAYAMQSYYTTR
jgi:hypothetical protein